MEIRSIDQWPEDESPGDESEPLLLKLILDEETRVDLATLCDATGCGPGDTVIMAIRAMARQVSLLNESSPE